MAKKPTATRKTVIAAVINHDRRAPFSMDIDEMLKKHESIGVIKDRVKTVKGDTMVHEFTVEDIQFVDTYITYVRKHNSIKLTLYINGREVDMKLLL